MEKIFNNWIFHTLVIIIITYIILIINKTYFKKFKNNKKIHHVFIENFIKFIVVLFAIFKIGNQNEAFHEFSTTILASSSLLVVVLGFALQKGLENIIHGIIISIFHPFNIGDRVTITLNGEKVTGYIESINLHHTIINNLITGSSKIVPNSIMDTTPLENFNYNNIEETKVYKNPVDISISYESNITMAKQIIKETIENNKFVREVYNEKTINTDNYQVNVLTRELQDSGISLRAFVYTLSLNDNFEACSEIRDELLKKFKENNIEIPYPHNTINGNISITVDELKELIDNSN